ncbi:hypothetical protein Rsub_04981 [Raphidocelis subcapitata]|uniref:Peptidase S54 rhomboid domain-containing protein n=1 Tax=Raphidocelis subcapitata TaxID=307507 RepID=A0A2V0NW75_9CHLO|nr:hypothetical protein Rsub_04981 [Raphidocelis subcapitata]|eukprot:GBF91876.1 hypothetical protein Rsub_04981 [Raphidocelis subcapitata]
MRRGFQRAAVVLLAQPPRNAADQQLLWAAGPAYCTASGGRAPGSGLRGFRLAPPSSESLAAAGCCGLALTAGLRSLLASATGGGASGTAAPATAGSAGAAPAPAPAARLAALAAALGTGLAAAAAAPAGVALANLTPNWDGLDRRWRGGRRWDFFGSGRRVTEILLGLNVAMYGLQQAYPGLVFKLARINQLISQGELWRLITPALLHGSFFHLAMNSVSLYLIGPAVEAALGSRRFAAVYAASAVTGNALAWAVQSTGFSLSVGASSSISGIFGAYVAFRFLNRGRYGISGGDLSWLAQVVGLNVLLQLGSHSIDGWSHLGGALGGAAMVVLLGPRPGRW